MKQGVNVYQIESRNPHLHASKGEKHVQSMISSSLQALYHSSAASQTLRQEILVEMRRRRLIGRDEEPAQVTRYPALGCIDRDKFAESLNDQSLAAMLAKSSL
jgi:mannosyl-3-phosphoglycerate synthase